ACEVGIVRFAACELAMPKAWLALHLPIDGCHHTERLRRTASPPSLALPVASLHYRFGATGHPPRSVPRQLYPPIAVAIAATPKTPTCDTISREHAQQGV